MMLTSKVKFTLFVVSTLLLSLVVQLVIDNNRAIAQNDNSQKIEKEIFIRPDSKSSKDTYITDQPNNFSGYADARLVVGKVSNSGVTNHSLFEYEVSNIPAGATVEEAKFYVYDAQTNQTSAITQGLGQCTYDADGPFAAQYYKLQLWKMVRSDWNVLQATWQRYKQGGPWDIKGGDIDSNLNIVSGGNCGLADLPQGERPVQYTSTWRNSFDITSIVTDARTNEHGKVRLLVTSRPENKEGSGQAIVSSEASQADLRPMVEVRYSVPSPTLCESETNIAKPAEIMLVVDKSKKIRHLDGDGRSRWNDEVTSVSEFLDAIDRHNTSVTADQKMRVGLATYGENNYTDQGGTLRVGLTDSLINVRSKMESMQPNGGAALDTSNIGPGIRVARQELASSGRSGVRRIIVVIGDGIESTSIANGVIQSSFPVIEADVTRQFNNEIYSMAIGTEGMAPFLASLPAPSHYYHWLDKDQDVLKQLTNSITAAITKPVPPDICPSPSPPPSYDLKLELQPNPNVVEKGTSERFFAKVSNVGGSAVPIGNLLVSMSVPSGIIPSLQYAYPPLPTIKTQGEATIIQWTRSSAGLGPTKTLSPDTSMLFLIDLPAGHYNKGEIRSCVRMASEADYNNDANHGNDCSSMDKTVIVKPVATSKVWSDTRGTEVKTLRPDQQFSFSLNLRNNTNQKITLSATDTLSLENSSDWDKTVSWTDTGGIGSTDNPLSWQIDLEAGQTEALVLSGKVTNLNDLLAKIAGNSTQKRCNTFSVTGTPLTASQTVKICWRYGTDADLAISKTLADGTKQKTLKQGAADGFNIAIVNLGPQIAINTSIDDYLREPNHVGSGHYINWDEASIAAGNGTIDSANPLKASWSTGRLEKNSKATKQPQFAVVCDTPVGTKLRNLAIAQPEASDPNPANNRNTVNNNPDVVMSVAKGTLRFKTETLPSSQSVVPSDATKNTATVNLTISNKGLGVDVAAYRVKVITNIPAGFSITDAAGGNVQGQNIGWDEKIDPALSRLDPGAEVVKTIKLKAPSTLPGGQYIVKTEGSSASANLAKTCGASSSSATISVDAADPFLTKTTDQADLNKGSTARFTLNVKNDRNIAYGPRDPGKGLLIEDALDEAFSYDPNQSVDCQITSLSGQNGRGCDDAKQQIKPAVEGQSLRWSIREIPAQSVIAYSFNVVVRSETNIDACPKSVTNQIKSKDQLYPDKVKESGPITLNLFADQCLNGNIYTRNLVGPDEGITVGSIVIQPKSILSSNNNIVCSEANVSCKEAALKVGGYNTDQSVGLDFNKVVKRMFANIQTISSTTSKLPASFGNTGSFNLQSGGVGTLSDPLSLARYPDGRVWTALDLTISNPVKFYGKGTIIVTGNLNINANLLYGNSSSDSVGFIVLPTNGASGNVRFSKDVTRVTGSYYVPGTTTDTVTTTVSGDVQTGRITFEGEESNQLIANGLFIARQVTVDRAKIALTYDTRLGNIALVPPGFRFSLTPGDTQEGN